MSFKTPPQRRQNIAWSSIFFPGNACFADLRQRYSRLLPAQWPTISDLNYLAQHLRAGFTAEPDQTLPICFTTQSQTLSALEYELWIATRESIPIRPDNWHDVFNALMWLSYPCCKTALNRIHASTAHAAGHPLTSRQPIPLQLNTALQTGATTANQRTRQRDFATLLDEAGIIIASTNDSAYSFNQAHNWQALFIEQRQQWWTNWRPFIIGHGLYEQCLLPYLGLTAKALYCRVPRAFFDWSLAEQYRFLDQYVAHALHNQHYTNPRQLLPLPVLGIPGWWAANQDPAFYNNRNYFRPKRQQPQ